MVLFSFVWEGNVALFPSESTYCANRFLTAFVASISSALAPLTPVLAGFLKHSRYLASVHESGSPRISRYNFGTLAAGSIGS